MVSAHLSMLSSIHVVLTLRYLQLDVQPTRGTCRVKYQDDSEWDLHIDGGRSAIDLSLILPHYRARHQPVDHRMSMFVANDNEPIKLKVVRLIPPIVLCMIA